MDANFVTHDTGAKMSIGLMRGSVKVVPWDKEWPVLFEHERKLLARHIGHLVLDIQHVGSTAVEGLSSKPIIDIAVAVEPGPVIDSLRKPLELIGYIDRGDNRDGGGHLFVKESAPEFRTHYLHIIKRADRQWKQYLRFRDMLREHKDLRLRYEVLKRDLESRYGRNRKEYTEGKEDFIRGILGIPQ